MAVAVIYLDQDAAYPSPEFIGLFPNQDAALRHTSGLLDAAIKYRRAKELHVEERNRITKEFMLRNRHALRLGREKDSAEAYAEQHCGELAVYLDKEANNWCGYPQGEVERFLHIDMLEEPLPSFDQPRWKDFDDGRPRREGCNFYYFPCEMEGDQCQGTRSSSTPE